jgi:hypothetical protein
MNISFPDDFSFFPSQLTTAFATQDVLLGTPYPGKPAGEICAALQSPNHPGYFA